MNENRLIHEKSPYLLQHAHQPVDWYPWGEEAFEKARREKKPVFLSIGYSTCHWCHVMKKESFDDHEVAALLNERFVAIKVDREERPDLDQVYMAVCQGLTGQGGWPLNVFLTADQRPFYAGVYFPKEDRYGSPGFKSVITQLSEKYTERHEEIHDYSKRLTESLQRKMKQEPTALQETILHTCFNQLGQMFDSIYGGFSQAPKFPAPTILTYLLRYGQWQGNDLALQMVERTLDAMADGGIYDQIGYGFSRYAVDQMWLVPHFEKMLYDNALLLIAYVEAYQVTKKPRYQQIAAEIIQYVTTVMRDEQGGFYCAEDADSEGEEGKYYVFSKTEIERQLPQEQASAFCALYDITDEGNFEGNNVPNLIHQRKERIAQTLGITEEKLSTLVEQARQTLYRYRETRIPPHKDDKILTSWNALMIVGLAKAAAAWDEPAYREHAKSALSFIEKELVIHDRVMVRYREGDVQGKGFIDDYAFLAWAYLEMYEATFDDRYISKAQTLTQDMLSLFWDESHGGFYYAGNDAEQLIVTGKEAYDGAMPSGNGVAAYVLWKLGKLTADPQYDEKLEALFDVFSSDLSHYPTGHTQLLQVWMLTQMKTAEVVLVAEQEQVASSLRTLQKTFLPHVVWFLQDPRERAAFTSFQLVDRTKKHPMIYVCENFHCQRPSEAIEEAIAELIEMK
ncbi:hypothetical protein A374_03694 [Fictibacillus macauensis ZFHKF-1]|uniref:Spermatogenesis-associated protein 20-like TRX domain-containing protein n=1 Tax=Fictibacillus macauensis ZFHKF-1 TaxID=1196324 RepID=I8UIJ3_9BACL|nr:thioredoxin domain-containing protein [Fictibacillus macauensis]EIT86643.1 hypothetical protein A374_03694 [Fictibacillus macauensis ZFHKF-1]